TLALGVNARAADAVDPPGGENLEMNKHFTDRAGQVGDFPGKLVCLRSKESFVPLSAEDCASGERVYALQMESQRAMRPIKAGDEHVEQQLHELLGKTVMVSGRYESST